MKIANILKHLKTINKHKWWVFVYCCKAGIPFRGLVHDLSKFSPTEFCESVKYFDGKISPIVKCKEINGVSYAWLHHKGRNRHHYEYWQDNFDKGGHPVVMPFKYALEQICDFLGAGKAYMGKDFTYQAEYQWWLKKISNPVAMHPQTKQFTELMLLDLYENSDLTILKKKNSLKLYIQAAQDTQTTLPIDIK